MQSKKITAPLMGDYSIAYGSFFKKLGYDVIMPPASSKKSLDFGVKHAPNQSCFPFKATLGNLFEGLNAGANVVAMIGGRTGICRLAYYSDMYKKVLSNSGYNFEILPVTPKKRMWDVVKKHFPQLKLVDFIKRWYEFWHKIRLIEIAREQALLSRAYERERGATSKLYKKIKERIKSVHVVKEMKRLRKEICNEFLQIPKDENRKTVRVGVVGEFFLLLDQFATMDMEETLGELGVNVDVSEKFSEFFFGSIKLIRFFDKFFPTERRKINIYAKPFINRPIGGHALQSVGYTIDYAKRGFDGVILLYPFTCMPQITTVSIISSVSEKYNIPVLALCFDEQTGKLGVQTRLEAFTDMLKRKKYGTIV